MQAPHEDPEDLCERLLGPPAPSPTSPPDDAILEATLRVLRGRRRWRRGLQAAALAASFATGMLVMHAWFLPPEEPKPPAIAHRPDPLPPPPQPQPRPEPERRATAPAPDPSLPPAMLERLAELADADARAAHYLVAGKAHERQGDLPAALRCYRRALEPGGGIDLAIVEGDTYLIMVLKNNLQKEKRRANNDT
ncbi:MAG: hypothetical protein AB7K24_20575 [Gemmataceae bacterium]